MYHEKMKSEGFDLSYGPYSTGHSSQSNIRSFVVSEIFLSLRIAKLISMFRQNLKGIALTKSNVYGLFGRILLVLHRKVL